MGHLRLRVALARGALGETGRRRGAEGRRLLHQHRRLPARRVVRGHVVTGQGHAPANERKGARGGDYVVTLLTRFDAKDEY
ncbi:MAG: hypothetical protein M3315_11635 [Actinomycetota bacterium]|nr:hypothetical protein [Actinomycetota bacterium]